MKNHHTFPNLWVKIKGVWVKTDAANDFKSNNNFKHLKKNKKLVNLLFQHELSLFCWRQFWDGDGNGSNIITQRQYITQYGPVLPLTDVPSPHPCMCPVQHACYSSISCVWGPAFYHVPDGNRLTNQRAASSCRTKTKQFTSRCQEFFHANFIW